LEAADSVPSFLLFAIQGCNAPGLFADPWSNDPVLNEVRPVMIPLILLLAATVSMLIGFALWWREVAKGIPMALIGTALICTLGFLGYQGNDVYLYTPSFETFLTGGNYFIAVGEFSLYLLFVVVVNLASFIVVWREVGWDTERNLLILATGATGVMTLCWVFFSIAVWNCV